MNQSAEESKAPYWPLYTSNWMGGTIGLSLEEEGFYLRICMRMWERQAGLPDDIRWLADATQVDPRTVRRLRQALIDKRKCESRDGHLVVRRVLRDISARQRHKKPAALPVPPEEVADTLAEVQGDLWPISAEDQPKISRSLGEKPNEINKTEPHTKLSQAKLSEEKKDNSQPASVETDAARDGGQAGDLCSDHLIEKISEWNGGDTAAAERWLSTFTGLYGRDVVRDGVAKLTADIAAGQRVAQPIVLLAAIVKRLDAKLPDPTEARERSEPPWIAQKRREDREWAEFIRERSRANAAAEAAA